METLTYKSTDETKVALDLYRANAHGLAPTVVFIHGGGLILGSRKAVLPLHTQACLDAGFNFVSIDYRLAPETSLPEIVADVGDAWSWLRSHSADLGIDRAKMVLMGHSAGAYLALLGGCRLDPRPAAIVSMPGYGRLRTAAFTQPSRHYIEQHGAAEAAEAKTKVGAHSLSESGPGDSIQWFTGRGLYYLFCRQNGSWLSAVSGHDASDEQWYVEFEPIRNATREFPPTLLLHGEPDTDVAFEESVLMQRELARCGVECELLGSPVWSHAFPYMAHDPSVVEAFSTIVTFLKKHV